MTQFPNPNDPPTQAAYGPPQDFPPQYPPQQPQYPPQQPQYPPQQPQYPPQSAPPQQPQYPPPPYGQPPAYTQQQPQYGQPPSPYGPPQSGPPQSAPPQSPPGYGYQQPAYGYPGYGPVTPPKSKLPLVLGIIGGILVLAMGIGVVAALASTSDKSPSAHGTTTPPATQPVNTGDPNTGDPNTGGPTDAGGGGDTQGLAIGTGATVTDSKGTMTVTVNSVKYRTTGCDTGDFNISNPQPGDAYIVIETTYQVTQGTGSYNPFDWAVVDTDGNESHDPGIFADCKPELNSGNSLTGKRHGLVVIEVKKGVQHGQIVYAPGFGEASATWKF